MTACSPRLRSSRAPAGEKKENPGREERQEAQKGRNGPTRRERKLRFPLRGDEADRADPVAQGPTAGNRAGSPWRKPREPAEPPERKRGGVLLQILTTNSTHSSTIISRSTRKLSKEKKKKSGTLSISSPSWRTLHKIGLSPCPPSSSPRR